MGGGGGGREFGQETFLVCNLVMKWQILHAKLRFFMNMYFTPFLRNL